MWPAWALSFLALGGLAWEAARLTERLAGRAAAVGAGAMVHRLRRLRVVRGERDGGRAVRVGHRARMPPGRASGRRTIRRRGPPRRAAELVALAWVAALFRPEGALAALFVALTLAVFPRKRRAGAIALAAAGRAARPCSRCRSCCSSLTGSARSNTAVAKLLPGNPYYAGPALRAAVASYVRLLVGGLLNGTLLEPGEAWSRRSSSRAEAAPVAMAGLGAIAAARQRGRARGGARPACCSSR